MLKNTIILLPQPHKVVENELKVSFLAQSDTTKTERETEKEFFYQLPTDYADAITDYADPFLLGILKRAMQEKQDIYVKGKVSLTLLRNLREFQFAWSQWLPEKFSQVSITAEQIIDKPQSKTNQGGIVAFSGGVDASFTLWDNLVNPDNICRYSIKAAVMIHGFDIKLENVTGFERAFQKAKNITDAIGIPILSIATNLRHEPWFHVHGAALASCLTLLSGKYDKGFIASSESYADRNLNSCGSNCVSDHLLSSNNMSIIHQGTGLSRIEKEGKLGSWEVAMQNLRVCWQTDTTENCGKCEKCIHTMLGFRLKGYSNLPCFSQNVTNQQIRNLWITSEDAISDLEDIITTAKKDGIKADWLNALSFCIYKNKLATKTKNLLFGKGASPIWIKKVLQK